MSDKTLVMICGVNYSGTTMLDMMLGNTPTAASCGEVGSLFRPRWDFHRRPECSCGRRPCEHWGPLVGAREADFPRIAFEHWGVDRVVDSTKHLPWVYDRNQGPSRHRVINILIWKHPEDLAYSYWSRGHALIGRRLAARVVRAATGRRPEPSAAQLNHWQADDCFRTARRRFVRYHSRLLASGLPFAVVSYRRLCQDPSGALVDLCRRVGLDYSAGMEHFWAKDHHILYGNGGTRAQLAGSAPAVRGAIDPPAEFSEAYRHFTSTASRGRVEERLVGALEELGSLRPPAAPAGGRRRIRPAWYWKDRLVQVQLRVFGLMRSFDERV